MTTLIIGIVLFVGIHFARESGLKKLLLAKVGATPYRLIYALIALAGIVLMVIGKSSAPFSMIYEPPYQLRFVSLIVMIPACVLVTAGNLPMSHLRWNLKHPMLLGTIFWGAAHLWANGDLASLLLFGSLMCWAMVKFITLSQVAGAQTKKPSVVWDISAVVLGFVVYGLLLVYHGQLFGIGLPLA